MAGEGSYSRSLHEFHSKIGEYMKIVSIKPKTVTLQALFEKATADWQSACSAGKGVLTTYHPPGKPEDLVDAISLPLNGVHVRTRFGIRDARYVYATQGDCVRVVTGSGHSIECTKTHKLISREGWTQAGSLTVGESELELEDGSWTRVASVTEIGRHPVLDISVDDVHEYFGNGIVSHNSLLANQLSINQSRIGYKSTMVPLEMSVKETTARILSNVSGMDSINVFLKRLASGERDLVYKRYRRFQRECQRNNGRYTIYKPKGGVTIEQLINGVDDLDSDVVYVDYISLLDGADGDDQWRKLGQIARYSKIQAERKNRVIVLLVQVDETGRVRYSQAIKEHASLAWTFVATKTSREQGYITIDMLKGRNQVMRPFTFKVDYPTMTVSDLSPDEMARIGTGGDETGRPAKKKSASAADVTPDLAE